MPRDGTNIDFVPLRLPLDQENSITDSCFALRILKIEFLYLHYTFVVQIGFSTHLRRKRLLSKSLTFYLCYKASFVGRVDLFRDDLVRSLGRLWEPKPPKITFYRTREKSAHQRTVIDYFLRVAEGLLAQTGGFTVVGHARGFRVAGDATQMVCHDSRRNLGRWVKSGCHRGKARFVLVHTQSVSLISLVYDLAAQMPLGPVLTALTRGHWSADTVCNQPDDAFPLYCEKVHAYWNYDVHHKIKAVHPARLDIQEKEQFVEGYATISYDKKMPSLHVN